MEGRKDACMRERENVRGIKILIEVSDNISVTAALMD